MSDERPATVRGVGGMVATADRTATSAAIGVLSAGGNAVDAAIAANAAMAVVAPHLCGMGGDLLALVVSGNGDLAALNASGRAGARADAAALRAEGRVEMPFRHDVRSVTIPGCVDGWAALHERYATRPLGELLAPAIALAERGFAASPLLVAAARRLDAAGRRNLAELAAVAITGQRVRRPGAARALRAIAAGGRDGFYAGEFGDGLLRLGDGWFDESDLDQRPTWVTPLSTTAFGVELHTMPPNSQGYLTLATLHLADAVGLPDDPDDPAWAHVLVECAVAAGHDRPAVLHDGADGAALLAAIEARVDTIDRNRASMRWMPTRAGDTTYLCVVDADRMGVSLIQSNAAGFGSWLAEPNTGINLHNRGIGFSLTAGHPAELGPGRRPPHTLSPAAATRGGALAAVFGTMGGDAQPQILAQVAARLFRHGASPSSAIGAGRWALVGPESGFDTWTATDGPTLLVEGHAPGGWVDDLARRGHRVMAAPAWDDTFGHAHAIAVDVGGVLAGTADPRTAVGSCASL